MTELLKMGIDPEIDPDVRMKALASAAPYLYPRLSMQMVSTTTNTSNDPSVSHQALLDRVLLAIDRHAPAIQMHEAQTIEVATDSDVSE